MTAQDSTLKCPKCGHQYHGNSICLNMASDNDCSCNGCEPVVSPAPSKPENPEPELTPEPERVTALEPTQTKRLIAGGFNQGAKSQLLRSQIELPAIKIYWYNKGFEAGKPRASVEQIADVLDARYKKYVMSTCLNGAQFNLDTAKLIKELWEAV